MEFLQEPSAKYKYLQLKSKRLSEFREASLFSGIFKFYPKKYEFRTFILKIKSSTINYDIFTT